MILPCGASIDSHGASMVLSLCVGRLSRTPYLHGALVKSFLTLSGKGHASTTKAPWSHQNKTKACMCMFVLEAFKAKLGKLRSSEHQFRQGPPGYHHQQGSPQLGIAEKTVHETTVNMSTWDCLDGNFRTRYSTVRWHCLLSFWSRRNSNVGSLKCLSGSIYF